VAEKFVREQKNEFKALENYFSPPRHPLRKIDIHSTLPPAQPTICDTTKKEFILNFSLALGSKSSRKSFVFSTSSFFKALPVES
jgi:hypothetical protein